MKTEQTKPAGQRKKKAARACIHCQKAHLTCDDSRPCQRCIKRNLATTCTDGARKKAKYLQDIEDAATTSSSPGTPFSTTSPMQTPPNMNTPFGPETAPFQTPNFLNTGSPSLTGLTNDNANLSSNNNSNTTTTNNINYNYGFGSNATNLEYSILSNMLGSPLTDTIPNAQTPTSADVLNNIWSQQQSPILESVAGTPLSLMNAANVTRVADPTFLTSSNHLVSTSAASNVPSSSSPFNNSNMTTTSNTTNNNNTPPNAINNNNRPIASISSSAMGTSQISSSGISTLSAYGDGAVVANVASPVTASTGPAVRRRNQIITPEMAYASATKPFSYADGYHYLINYVKTRMSREDLMRISRALALFRPSVLASMMNLTEDDLVFTEKCLQRTLLEYEKLISYSGTPTVVWRRTGEITLVGKEFSLLTQWSRDMLLGKKTYIYELMSNPSAVEYWEKYALHAFDNTDSAVYSTCILMSPTKRIVPCTFCFTIKRDIFDLPSVIVGNFLPILS
ncbi:transcription factor [Mucor ambiguus]|uniref:Transcription factor n=1 Tax=Mucor ambiguus TaxID=91626 RepID=A0A0C9M4M2_9FUNG|nr:transcription factor [Mucor ambiguus]